MISTLDNASTFIGAIGGTISIIAALVSAGTYFSPTRRVKRLDALQELTVRYDRVSTEPMSPKDRLHPDSRVNDIFAVYLKELDDAHFYASLGPLRLVLILAFSFLLGLIPVYFSFFVSNYWISVLVASVLPILIIVGSQSLLAFLVRRTLTKKTREIDPSALRKFLQRN